MKDIGQVHDSSISREPSIYDLAFLHIEVRWIREFNLNELELLVFGFINSYRPSTGKIYFSNAQLGEMFNKSEVTISRTISSLKDKNMIDVEMQTNSLGGTIRYLRPTIQQNPDLSKMTRGVIKNEGGGYQKRLPNSNKNSNKNIYNNSQISQQDEYKKERARRDREIEETYKLIRRGND